MRPGLPHPKKSVVGSRKQPPNPSLPSQHGYIACPLPLPKTRNPMDGDESSSEPTNGGSTGHSSSRTQSGGETGTGSSVLSALQSLQDQFCGVQGRLKRMEEHQGKTMVAVQELKQLMKQLKQDSFTIKGSPLEVGKLIYETL